MTETNNGCLCGVRLMEKWPKGMLWGDGHDLCLTELIITQESITVKTELQVLQARTATPGALVLISCSISHLLCPAGCPQWCTRILTHNGAPGSFTHKYSPSALTPPFALSLSLSLSHTHTHTLMVLPSIFF